MRQSEIKVLMFLISSAVALVTGIVLFGPLETIFAAAVLVVVGSMR